MPYALNDETSIYYETYGEPGRPAIVFAHEAGGNAASWWQQVPVRKARGVQFGGSRLPRFDRMTGDHRPEA